MHSQYKNLVVSLLVGTALMGSTYPASSKAITATNSYENQTSTMSVVASAASASKPILTVKEPGSLDLWLEKLAEKESTGRDHIKILDVNNKYSYGCLQFQEWTFRTFGTKYGLVSPRADLEPLIYDCNLQKQIAKRMIQEDYKLWQSWYTSVTVKNLGLPPRS